MNRLLRPRRCWLLPLLLAGCVESATLPAQRPVVRPAADAAPVYTYVEQMPELPQGGGLPALIEQIFRQFHPPPLDSKHLPASRVQVAFIVESDGTLQQIRLLVSSQQARLDNALLHAVRSLPRLTPGYHQGRPVRVQLCLPITLDYR